MSTPSPYSNPTRPTPALRQVHIYNSPQSHRCIAPSQHPSLSIAITMYYITQALHVPQAILSAYGLFLSYQSISKLREYEAASEKAAEWSQTAADQLHKTRTTQASGAITVCPSLLSTVPFLSPPSPYLYLSPLLPLRLPLPIPFQITPIPTNHIH